MVADFVLSPATHSPLRSATSPLPPLVPVPAPPQPSAPAVPSPPLTPGRTLEAVANAHIAAAATAAAAPTATGSAVPGVTQGVPARVQGGSSNAVAASSSSAATPLGIGIVPAQVSNGAEPQSLMVSATSLEPAESDTALVTTAHAPLHEAQQQQQELLSNYPNPPSATTLATVVHDPVTGPGQTFVPPARDIIRDQPPAADTAQGDVVASPSPIQSAAGRGSHGVAVAPAAGGVERAVDSNGGEQQGTPAVGSGTDMILRQQQQVVWWWRWLSDARLVFPDTNAERM